MSQPFLDAVFRGTRFQGSELPVETLQELTAYRELLVAVARSLFLAEHPTRRRVPRGFSRSLSLSLSGIQNGSTIATLSRRVPPPVPLGEGEGDVFERARELIGETLASVNANSQVPDRFPDELLPMFDRLGRKLKDGDSIEFRSGGAACGPRFNVDTKRRILRHLQDEIDVAVVAYVQVAGVQVVKKTADLLLPSGREVVGEVTSEMLATITEVMPKYESTWLRVSGTASVDGHDRIMKFTELEEVDIVDDEHAATFAKVLARIDELQSLEDGWLDGEGTGLEGRDSTWTRETLLLVIGDVGLPKPGVFPTPEGDIQAEWSFGDVQLTIRFDLVEPGINVEVFDASRDVDDAKSFKRSERDSAVEYINRHLSPTEA